MYTRNINNTTNSEFKNFSSESSQKIRGQQFSSPESIFTPMRIWGSHQKASTAGAAGLLESCKLITKFEFCYEK